MINIKASFMFLWHNFLVILYFYEFAWLTWNSFEWNTFEEISVSVSHRLENHLYHMIIRPLFSSSELSESRSTDSPSSFVCSSLSQILNCCRFGIEALKNPIIEKSLCYFVISCIDEASCNLLILRGTGKTFFHIWLFLFACLCLFRCDYCTQCRRGDRPGRLHH